MDLSNYLVARLQEITHKQDLGSGPEVNDFTVSMLRVHSAIILQSLSLYTNPQPAQRNII